MTSGDGQLLVLVWLFSGNIKDPGTFYLSFLASLACLFFIFTLVTSCSQDELLTSGPHVRIQSKEGRKGLSWPCESLLLGSQRFSQRPSLARTESHGHLGCRGWEREVLAQVVREKKIWNGYWATSEYYLPLNAIVEGEKGIHVHN